MRRGCVVYNLKVELRNDVAYSAAERATFMQDVKRMGLVFAIFLLLYKNPPRGRLTKRSEVWSPKRTRYTLELNLTLFN